MSVHTKTPHIKNRSRPPRIPASLQVVSQNQLIPWREAFADLIEQKSKVGAYIAGLRYREGYTQKQLAAILGCTQTLVSRLENGSRKPTDDLIKKMAKLFKSHYESFFPEEKDSGKM